ncbi:MAG: PAS domain S-box protein, partial [Verrucomicrobia bacterium]|nr:PAS domain S-box protein [Verrucomicrobiota bacterium]
MNHVRSDVGGQPAKPAGSPPAENKPAPADGKDQPLNLLVLVILAAFVAAALVNLFFSLWSPLPIGAQAVCYALLFVVLIFPVVYFTLFRPLARQIAERQRAEEALREAGSSLEAQVAERTEALIRANQELRTEITERQRAEKSRARAIEKYRNIFENAVEGIFQTTPDGRHLTVNPALARMLGYESAEELIAAVSDIEHQLYVDPARRAEFKRLIEEHGIVERFEIQLRRKDGSAIWVSENARAVRAADGRVLCYEGSMEDITARKLMEETLRHSEEVFRSIIENLTDMVLVMEANRAISFGSPSIERVLGYKSEDYLGHDAFEFVHPDDVATVTATLARVLENPGVPQTVEYRARHKGGSWRILESTGKTIAGRPGPAAVVINSRDITERRHAEEEHLRLTTAVEQAAESIAVTDANGTILYVNPAFQRISGYTRQETLGQNPRVLKSGKHDAAFYKQMWDTLLRGEVWTGRIINKKKDGSLYEEDVTISPVRDAAGKTVNYVAVKRDVTREATLEGQLRQAQKMEAVGRLAGGVAHDFNNILTAILGYGDLALRRLDPNDPVRGYLAEVKQSAERAASLTRQLLAFSRKQVLVPQPRDLNALVTNLQKMLRRLIGEDIHFTTQLAPSLGRIKADAGQIEQVILNLAVNARDAMPHGGSLTITTTDADLDAAYAGEHVEVKPGRYVMLAVTDTGIGMTPEVKGHLFEP